MNPNSEEIIREKTARLQSAHEKVRQFVDAGGDFKSPEAAPLGLEFIEAYLDLAKEVDSPEKSQDMENLEALLRLFSFKKKSELKKYCREIVVDSTAFVNLIIACESGQLNFLHRIHYLDYVPQHLNPTGEDLAALSGNPVGPLKPDAQKAIRKIGQIFKDRRYLVGHIFYLPDLSEWHFFQFDQRDLEDGRVNHWGGGSHIHFLNWLWPGYDAETLWASFASGKEKMGASLHLRYFDDGLHRKRKDHKSFRPPPLGGPKAHV